MSIMQQAGVSPVSSYRLLTIHEFASVVRAIASVLQPHREVLVVPTFADELRESS